MRGEYASCQRHCGTWVEEVCVLSKTDCECHDYVTCCRILVGSGDCPASDVGGKDGAAQHRADDGVVGGTGASGVDCERLDVSLGLEPFTLPGEEEVRAGVSVPYSCNLCRHT